MESPLQNLGPGSRKVRVERQAGPDGKIYELRVIKETILDSNGIYTTYEEIDVPRDTTPEGKLLKVLKLFFRCINWVIYE
jgi:hypothetical protein